ncbi:MAG: methyltransferase domain-containing protein [Acidobacteriota bacterium]|nr:MAG: methyltransferase domain-containing protein [Acidobacteriota bacterium]
MSERQVIRNARITFLLAAFAILCFAGIAGAQEESIYPGVNDSFENPNVEEWITLLEGEERVLYNRRDDIVAVLELEPAMEVADIGAGTGLFTMLFAVDVGPTGTVYAVDIAENFVNHITDTAKELGLENVKGIVNSAETTGLKENSVDVVFICETYHHFEYPSKMLASIRSALRPDGTVVLVDFERIEGITEEFVLKMVRAGKGTFTDEFKNAGFELIEEVPFTDEHYILKFKLRP